MIKLDILNKKYYWTCYNLFMRLDVSLTGNWYLVK